MLRFTCTLCLLVLLATPALAANLDNGKTVYEKNCAMCHKSGIAGSPKLDDKAAWTDRLAQGDTVLIEHSIKGYRGSTGYMPPKGGKSNLSDADVADAVMYMISTVK